MSLRIPKIFIAISACAVFLPACRKEAPVLRTVPLVESQNRDLKVWDSKDMPVIDMVKSRGMLFNGKAVDAATLREKIKPLRLASKQVAFGGACACSPNVPFRSFIDLLQAAADCGMLDVSLLVNGRDGSIRSYPYHFISIGRFPWMTFAGNLRYGQFDLLRSGKLVTDWSGSGCAVEVKVKSRGQYIILNKVCDRDHIQDELAELRRHYSPVVMYITAGGEVPYEDVIDLMDTIHVKGDTPYIFTLDE